MAETIDFIGFKGHQNELNNINRNPKWLPKGTLIP